MDTAHGSGECRLQLRIGAHQHPRPGRPPPPSNALIGGAQMLSLPGGITCHTTTKEYECHNDRVSFFFSLQAVCA